MIGELSIAAIGVFTSGLSAWISHNITRKKYKAEVESETIAGMRSALEFYKSLSDDNRTKLEELKKENMELRREIDTLRDQLQALTLHLSDNYAFLSRADLRAKQLFNKEKSNAKAKDRLDKTEASSRRGRKSAEGERDSSGEKR